MATVRSIVDALQHRWRPLQGIGDVLAASNYIVQSL
jgi:hypothetical protein